MFHENYYNYLGLEMREIMSKYKFERTVNAEFSGISLRALLSEKWLLPRKFIHFLRIRENVKINGNYYPINTIVQGNQISLKESRAILINHMK